MDQEHASSPSKKIWGAVLFVAILLVSVLWNNSQIFFPNKTDYFIEEQSLFSVKFPAFMNKPRKSVKVVDIADSKEKNIIYTTKNENAEIVFWQINIPKKLIESVGSEQNLLEILCKDEFVTGNGINISTQKIKFKDTYNSIKFSYISTNKNNITHKRDTNVIGSIIFAKSQIYKLTYIPLSEDANNCKDCAEKICAQFLDSLNIY